MRELRLAKRNDAEAFMWGGKLRRPLELTKISHLQLAYDELCLVLYRLIASSRVKDT